MDEPKPAEPFVPVRVPLKVKLGLLITALVVLAVVLVGAFLLKQQQHSLTAEMTKRGLTIAQNFAASAKTPLLTGDELTLAVLVKDAMKDPDVAYVVVTDAQGRALAESDPSPAHGPVKRPDHLQPLRDQMLVQTYTAAGRRLIDFAVPLVYSHVPVGGLYLGFSQGAIELAHRTARNQALLIMLGMLGVGVVGAMGLATVLSRPIFRLVEGTRAIAGGDLDVTLKVGSRDELGVLTESFNQMVRHLREKEMIKRAFSRYVAREVVEEILKDPEHLILSGERREVTVLFCDMRGFTPLSERLSPEEVVLLLNDFYTLTIETTFKHDGTLDKFMGDAVMAIFGAPIRHADHSVRAVRTAIDMREGMIELNERRRREGKEPIGIGIGVSAGEAVAGTVGTEDRMEYTVVGDSVNLAARLQANAGTGQILISQRTWEHVRDAVETRHLGPLKVKGKEEEVEVYEVVGMRDPASDG
jgi:adenylate cyclase